MKKHGYNNLYSSANYDNKFPRMEAQDEKVQKVIMDEIKSIQTERHRNIKDGKAFSKKTNDEYYKEVQEYLLNKKQQPSLNTFTGLEYGTDQFFRNKQLLTEEVLGEYFTKIDMTKYQFFTSSRDYHKDRYDKLKILRFYEEHIHKLRRTYEVMLRDDLTKFKEHFENQMKNIIAVTSTIYDEYLNIYQRKMVAEYTKVINDETKNVYDQETYVRLRKIARIQTEDFLNYKPMFPDFIKLTNFYNQNLELKKKFISENFRSNIFNDVSLSSYLEMFNKSLDELTDFTNMKAQIKMQGKSQEQIFGLKADEFIKYKNKTDEFVGMTLPPEDQVIFEMGDTTKKAEPYWKLNMLTIVQTVPTTHNPTETINDLVLTDKDRYALTGSEDQSVRVTNIISGDTRLAIPATHKGGSKGVYFLSSGIIVSGGFDGEIKLYDPTIGLSKGVLVGHKDRIWRMIELPGEALVSGSEDHSVKLWNIEQMRSYKNILSPQNKPVRCLGRYNESKFFYSSHRVWLYNCNTDQIEKTFSGHTAYVLSMGVDKKRNRLITGSEDKTLRFWSIESGDLIKTILCSEIRGMEIWQDEFLLTGHSTFEIKFWDLNMLRLICLRKTKIFVNNISITKDNKIIYPEYNELVILKNPGM